VGEFEGTIETILPVPCTYDLNIAATKYFSALDGGTISWLFLFSGTVFYAAADRRLQVERISWNKECVFQMPVSVWQEMMDQHYPNSAWIYLHRDVFERVVDYKRDQGLPTWEQPSSGCCRNCNQATPIMNASLVVTANHAGYVLTKARVGGIRVVDMLSGEQLPWIC
jgi:Family of unknown function (DUF6084)